MKQNSNDNAANRNSFIGAVHTIGERMKKEEILLSLKPEWRKLHMDGYIHIHDLDAYDLTYNCLTFNLINHFPTEMFEGLSDQRKVIRLFDFLKLLFEEVGNEQSGGMAFANFDDEVASMLSQINVSDSPSIRSLIKDCVSDLILWCNNNHTRMGKTSYYITFNIGLASSNLARFIAEALIDEYGQAGERIYKPNIVFKVCKRINGKGTPNYYLLQKALECTTRKMIPTYLLCDSAPDKSVDPRVLSIMGCRTRVVDDLYGEKGAIGRGNVDNISINLPRIAFETNVEDPMASDEIKIEEFIHRWDSIAEEVKNILLDRFNQVCSLDKEDFPVNSRYQLWCENFNAVNNLHDIFKHGTLSIGFIGLSEALEILTGKKFWRDGAVYNQAQKILQHMRSYTDSLTKQYQLNFSLLATSGEMISGRFPEKDKKLFSSPVLEKGYYTNSFHIDVDSNLPAFRKIQIEGPFHIYANGGSITYVELGEAPLGNSEGLEELLEVAVESGVHYLGFNYPKDICDDCGATGTFDTCPICGCQSITRIRRVSGYLEIQDGFTTGKKHEVERRRRN